MKTLIASILVTGTWVYLDRLANHSWWSIAMVIWCGFLVGFRAGILAEEAWGENSSCQFAAHQSQQQEPMNPWFTGLMADTGSKAASQQGIGNALEGKDKI